VIDMADECKYAHDIERMKTDTTVLLTKMDDVQKDVDKLGNKIDKLSDDLHNGPVEEKVEKAIDARNGRLLMKIIFAVVSSTFGFELVAKWLSGLFK